MERSARSSKNQAAANKGSKAASGKKDSHTKDNQSLLRKFFVEESQDIYWAEKHLAKELPKLQKAATSEELADAFGDHQAETEEHVNRLEDVFKMMEIGCHVYILYVHASVEKCLREHCSTTGLGTKFNWYLF